MTINLYFAASCGKEMDCVQDQGHSRLVKQKAVLMANRVPIPISGDTEPSMVALKFDKERYVAAGGTEVPCFHTS